MIDGRYVGSTMLIVWYEDGSVDFFEIRVTPPPYPQWRTEVEVIHGLDSKSYGRYVW